MKIPKKNTKNPTSLIKKCNFVRRLLAILNVPDVYIYIYIDASVFSLHATQLDSSYLEFLE